MDHKSRIVAIAEKAHKQYPQYKGMWNGPEWIVKCVIQRVSTKLGTAFEVGDYTIVNYDCDDEGFVTAYSVRNQMNTVIPRGKVS